MYPLSDRNIQIEILCDASVTVFPVFEVKIKINHSVQSDVINRPILIYDSDLLSFLGQEQKDI